MRLLPLFLVALSIACAEDPTERVARAYVEDPSLETIRALLAELERGSSTPRALRLRRQLEARAGQLELAQGRKLSFDEESRLLYGAVASPPNQREIDRARAELDELLPGTGPLAPRYFAFQKRFHVPEEKLDSVLRRALDESRDRTREGLELPAHEEVAIEYVSGAPWPSFSTYLGGHRSLIQVNRDFPLAPGAVLEIATHEAYPGHHVLSLLGEASGRVELSIEPLVGPDALIREGLASYGIELAFPGRARLELEKELFGLSGFDPADATLSFEVERRVRSLASLRVDGARRYLDGVRDRVQSVIDLEEQALVPAPWAFLRFVDRYRSYVVAYTEGVDLARRRAAGSWDGFVDLLLGDEHET